MPTRTVYYVADLFEQTGEGLPIRREAGYGVVASRAQLRDYLQKRLGTVEEVPVES